MSRGLRALAVVLGLAGIVLAVVAGFRNWAFISVSDLPGVEDTPLSGRRAAPSVVPIALAAGAAVIVMVTSGRVIRFLVAAGLTAAGAGIAISSLNARQDAVSTAAKALETVTGLFGQNSLIAPEGLLAGATAELTVWSWVSLAGGVLVACSGLLGLLTGQFWPGPATRFESGSAAAPPGAGGGFGDEIAGGSATGRHTGPVDDAQAWDALTRGDDPT